MSEEKEIDYLIKPDFNIGDIVVLKSYPDTVILKGEENNISPYMVVTGIEIENKKKKTNDNELGVIIAGRIKYNLIWFDSKKSIFVDKILYQDFLKPPTELIKYKNAEYSFGGIVRFKTFQLEFKKKKLAKSYTLDEKGNEIVHETFYSLLIFVSPSLVISGIRVNNNKSTYNDFGKMNKILPTKLVKVTWFNYTLQKFSEQELPLEALIIN